MITMTELTIEPLKRGLQQMSGYLDHAQKHIIDYGIAPDSLLAARLAPGMMTFSAQVQRASDNAKNGVARLTGTVAPSFPDTETDIEQLKTRLSNTVKHLGTLTSGDFVGAERRLVQLRFLSISGDMTGFEYLTRFLLPNFYFHIATAHAILRHQGVDIGKKEYLGPLH
ncbi:DUF1993 domain-containing protein [Caballeronia sp. M23-90]